jgi:AraC family transcriptional regulator
MVGESVKGHIRRLRLERAAIHLKQTQRPVTRIAFEAGYEAHESFTRAFRDWFGMSPSHPEDLLTDIYLPLEDYRHVEDGKD